MRPIFAAVVIVSLSSCFPAFGAGYGPVAPESFLQYSVGTVPELGKEVTISPIVRARLAQHFHVSYAEIGRYVLHNLSLSRLEKAGVYHVACLRHDGSEYWIQSRLPAGTLVFTSRVTGEPILKLACGNPMAATLPQETGDSSSTMSPPQISQTDAAPNQTNAPDGPVLMAESLPLDTALVTSPLAPETEELLVPDPVVKTAGSLEFARFAPALADLGPALATAAAIAALSGSHGNNGKGSTAGVPDTGIPGGGTTPGQPAPPTPTPNPVPESSTSVAFASLLLLGGMKLMARRKKTA